MKRPSILITEICGFVGSYAEQHPEWLALSSGT